MDTTDHTKAPVVGHKETLMGERFVFEGEIAQIDYGRMIYHCIYLPAGLVASLPFDQYPRLRVDAELNDWPLEAAWTPSKNGYFLHLSKGFLKQCGLRAGDAVSVRFTIGDQDAVELCDELTAALEGDETAMAAWARLTSGKKRGLAYQINGAKRPATREKRATALIANLKTGSLS